MAEVRVGENETFESALRRFNKKIQQSGILAEARRREHYEKPSVKRKRKEAKRKKTARADRLGGTTRAGTLRPHGRLARPPEERQAGDPSSRLQDDLTAGHPRSRRASSRHIADGDRGRLQHPEARPVATLTDDEVLHGAHARGQDAPRIGRRVHRTPDRPELAPRRRPRSRSSPSTCPISSSDDEIDGLVARGGRRDGRVSRHATWAR